MKRKIYRVFILVIVLSQILLSNSYAVSEDEKNFLWKVTTRNATLFLFGSIHLGKPDMYPLADIIESSFQESSNLVVEVNVEAVNPMDAMQIIFDVGLYNDGDYLQNHISQETAEMLHPWLARYHMRISDVFVYKPWLLAMTLQVLQIKQLGFDEEYGIDKYFLKKAKGNKNIIELETMEEQLNFLDGIDAQDMFLRYTLESMHETEQMLSQTISAWASGDVETMEKMLIDDILDNVPETHAIFETIIFERNINMTENIKYFLNSGGTYFVVVGAAHLVGEKGIVELLQREGYTIEQL